VDGYDGAVQVYALQAGEIESISDAGVLAWFEATGATFPVMVDSDGTYGRYDATGATAPFPLDVVVDQQGVVRFVDTRYDPDTLQAVIDGLLAE
jgi:hypothetical protein